MWSGELSAWLNRLDVEHDNLRAALAWSLDHDTEAGLRLAASLWQFWMIRCYLVQGSQWLARFLERHPQPSEPRAHAQIGACGLSIRLLDNEAGLTYARAALDTYEALSDHEGYAMAHSLIAAAFFLVGDYEPAEAHLAESRRLSQEIGLPHTYASATRSLAVLLARRGDYSAAEALLQEGLATLGGSPGTRPVAYFTLNIGWLPAPDDHYGPGRQAFEGTVAVFRAIDTAAARAYTLSIFGDLARLKRDMQRAETLLSEALDIFTNLQDDFGRAQLLRQLGNLATATGDYPRAEVLLRESLALSTACGDKRGIGWALQNLASVAIARADYDPAERLLDQADAVVEDTRDGPGKAAFLGVRARIAVARGEYEQARSLTEEAVKLWNRAGETFRGKEWATWAQLELAIVTGLQGDLMGALALLEESLAVFQGIGNLPGVAATLYQLGRISSTAGDSAAAAAYFAQASSIYEQLGDEPAQRAAREKLERLNAGH